MIGLKMANPRTVSLTTPRMVNLVVRSLQTTNHHGPPPWGHWSSTGARHRVAAHAFVSRRLIYRSENDQQDCAESPTEPHEFDMRNWRIRKPKCVGGGNCESLGRRNYEAENGQSGMAKSASARHGPASSTAPTDINSRGQHRRPTPADCRWGLSF